MKFGTHFLQQFWNKINLDIDITFMASEAIPVWELILSYKKRMFELKAYVSASEVATDDVTLTHVRRLHAI